MLSRERLLTAIDCKVPDRVPLYIREFSTVRVPNHLRHKAAFERVLRWAALEVDDIIDMPAPWGHHPSVTTRAWREEPTADEQYPLLHKEYDTPAGTLRQIVRKTPDEAGWPPQMDEIQLIDDFNVPRAVEHAVSGPEDLPKLRYLLTEPSKDQLAAFRTQMKETRDWAQEHGTLLAGWGSCGADGAVWFCGMEGAVLAAMDSPDFMDELLDIIHAYDKRCIELHVEQGVDMIVHRGWYQTTRLWSPALYRRFIKPRLNELVSLAHQNGTRFAYTMSSGIMPLLDDFLDIGFDCLYHVDPVQGDADLKAVKEKLGGKIALLGGMNSTVTMNFGTREEIRQAVFNAVEMLAKDGGFILNPVDNVWPDTPKESIDTLIEAWREVRDYYK